MKSRLLAVLVGALGMTSCFSPDDGGSEVVVHERPFSCERFTSCATCTPVLGCGWCQSGDKGLCVPDPDECDRATTFSWTWELAYCPADGGAATTPADAGAAD